MSEPPFGNPQVFVAAAQDATNSRDLAAILACYAPGSTLHTTTDGASETHRGTNELRRAWETYLAVMGRGSFTLAKDLVAVSEDSIVNTWTGTMAGKPARGVEVWRFDADGLVDHHTMYSFLNVRDATDPWMRVRLFISYPVTALRFLRAGREGRRGARGGWGR
jgi:nuclear transport factor 2 (NTF2) superfamily protein